MANMAIEEVVDSYREIASIPNVISGTLLPTDNSNRYILESIWQQKDLERTENIIFRKSSRVDVKGLEVKVHGKSSTFTTHVTSKEVLVKYTSCGKMKAIIREFTDDDKNKVHIIEIWDSFKKIVNVNLNEAEKHGPVHCDEQFGSLDWSSDNKKILYIAETKRPKSESYFKSSKYNQFDHGNKHVWEECWREQLTEAIRPTICVFDVSTKEIVVCSDNIPQDISAGQAIWHHDCESIIFVGWLHGPYKLGLLWTTTRENHIFLLNTKQQVCIKLTPNDISVRSPRLHPTDNLIVFLKNPVGGPHFHCTELASLCLPKIDDELSVIKVPSHQVIVGTVFIPNSEDDFPGLYLLNLLSNCWSIDGHHLFLSSFWRSHYCILDVNIVSGSVMRLTKIGFSTILDVRDDFILIGYSTPSNPPEIKIAKFISGAEMNWTTVDQPSKGIESLTWSVHSFKPELENSKFPNVPCEYILYEPVYGISIPKPKIKSLIVNPHGGPHTLDVAAFVHDIAVLCKLGYTVVQVNYRGSIGYGQSSIDSLPGNIGMQDVSDVHQVAKMLKNDLNIDRVFIEGLSHGGFLTLQLISQYPDFYFAACVKNPVTNLASMSELTDLPDWVPWEVDSKQFEFTSLPCKESYAAMLSKSPISHIMNAKAPCLVMLGKSDLRVPPSQGKQWAKKYRALGGTCKVLEYENNHHILNGVEAESDGFVNMVLWFVKYQNSLQK
ncbi:acylamino-acid-releasing enzyme-like [Styela clava]